MNNERNTLRIEKLSKSEKELFVAQEVGTVVLESLPLLQEVREKHLVGQTVDVYEKEKLLHLKDALNKYNQSFPNPLSTIFNPTPLSHMEEYLGYALERNWFGNSDVFPFINNFLNILRSEFNLPEMDKYPLTTQELFRLVKVPDQHSGFRFLPGFRKLNWNNSSHEYSCDVVYVPTKQNNIIRLKKMNGQVFKLGSTNTLYALEEGFKQSKIPFSVNAVVELNDDNAFKPYIFFDYDGTLTTNIDRFEDPSGYKNFDNKIRILIKKLFQDQTPVGIWTRSPAGYAKAIASEIKAIGKLCNPCYDFGNWPGFVCTEPDRFDGPKKINVLTLQEMTGLVEKLTPKVLVAVKIYAERLIGLSDINALLEKIHDFLFYSLTHEENYHNTEIIYKPYYYNALEAKAPILSVLFDPKLDENTKLAIINGGTLINDSADSLLSVWKFGYNFIYVDDSNEISQVSQILSDMNI